MCGHEDVDLLILVTSSLTHFDRRLAIRETWGRMQDSVKIMFLLGNTAEPDDVLEDEINTEYER